MLFTGQRCVLYTVSRTNTKLLHGGIGPIPTWNDYQNAVFDDVVTLRRNHDPQGKSSNLLQFSPCM